MGLPRASVLILCMGMIVSGAALASPKAAVAPVRAPVESPEACSAGAIRTAAAKQTAPAVTGCRYDVVAGPVARFFLALPVARKVDDPAALGTIIAQSPEAGRPLKPGGRLVLSVSTGRAPKAEEAASSGVSSVSSSSASSSSGASSSTAPVPGRPPEPKPEPVTPPQPNVPAEPEPPAPAQASAVAFSPEAKGTERPGRPLSDAPWPWIAGFAVLIVLIVAAASAGLRWGGLRRSGSRGSGLIAPAVTVRLTPGEARLKTRGSLVKGRKGLKE
ncbi:MAG: PASTA domain-containing protein [Asticcacaulis sp.]